MGPCLFRVMEGDSGRFSNERNAPLKGSLLGPQNTASFFSVQRLCPQKNGVIRPKTVCLSLFFHILSSKYGFYAAKYYAHLRQMTENSNLTGKNGAKYAKNMSFRGSTLLNMVHPKRAPCSAPHTRLILWMVAKSISHRFQTNKVHCLLVVAGESNHSVRFLWCEMDFVDPQYLHR